MKSIKIIYSKQHPEKLNYRTIICDYAAQERVGPRSNCANKADNVNTIPTRILNVRNDELLQISFRQRYEIILPEHVFPCYFSMHFPGLSQTFIFDYNEHLFCSHIIFVVPQPSSIRST